MKRVIGYGICGPGEANRYMKDTLDCFKRLCDEVVILCNNADKPEHDLIDSYGFTRVSDRREWGAHQWRIKQDFIERDIKQIAKEGDMLVCLDMDEVLDDSCTKEWLLEAPLDAYHVYVIDLWNDPQHFKLESCFWNVRIWRWNGETKFKAKPVHCGLAPEWAYHYHRHAPFMLLHKGLMLPEDRARKIKRYERYDPHAEYLDRKYYDMLRSNTARPFDQEAMHKMVVDEVASYKATKPRESMANIKKPRFAYVKNPHGHTLDIPEKHLQQTLKRPGFTFIGWADEDQDEIDEMFEDTDLGDVEAPPDPIRNVQGGSYHRSAADEQRELNERNAGDDLTKGEEEALFNQDNGGDTTVTGPTVSELVDAIPPDAHPKPNPNVQKTEQTGTAQTKVENENRSVNSKPAAKPNKAAAKKAPAKKAAGKKK
jgi:hypothetical protein